MENNRQRKKGPYTATFTLWGRYWTTYGGWKALAGSLYFALAMLITLFNFHAWLNPGWWEVVIATIPTLLGFTLAGLAVFLSMDSGFSKFIAGKTKTGKPSPFMELIASFVHFITIQALAFLYALTAKSLYFWMPGLPEWYYISLPYLNGVAGAIGYFLFLYSIFLVLSATFVIFRSSRWYDMYMTALKQEEERAKMELQEPQKPRE